MKHNSSSDDEHVQLDDNPKLPKQHWKGLFFGFAKYKKLNTVSIYKKYWIVISNDGKNIFFFNTPASSKATKQIEINKMVFSFESAMNKSVKIKKGDDLYKLKFDNYNNFLDFQSTVKFPRNNRL